MRGLLCQRRRGRHTSSNLYLVKSDFRIGACYRKSVPTDTDGGTGYIPLKRKNEQSSCISDTTKNRAAVINETGCPCRVQLLAWYQDYRKNDTKLSKDRYQRYSDEQKCTAVDHYLAHGRCNARTKRALGYPSKKVYEVFAANKGCYGRRRIYDELADSGTIVAERVISAIMGEGRKGIKTEETLLQLLQRRDLRTPWQQGKPRFSLCTAKLPVACRCNAVFHTSE